MATIDDVYKEVLEQAENFKRYHNLLEGILEWSIE